MTEFSVVMYIEPNDKGKPCVSLAKLRNELVRKLDLSNQDGVAPRRKAGRKAVRITLLVEEV